MKTIAFGLGGFGLLLMAFLAVVLATYVRSAKNDSSTNTIGVTRTVTEGIAGEPAYVRSGIIDVVTGTQDIPIYPGARQYSAGEMDNPYAGQYGFTTQALISTLYNFVPMLYAYPRMCLCARLGVYKHPPFCVMCDKCWKTLAPSCKHMTHSITKLYKVELMEDINIFYKQELANAGWVLTNESRFGNSIGLDFTWKNPANEVPLRRYLMVGLSTSTSISSTSILLDFERWPDPNQVPLYPEAQQVETKDGTEPEFGYYQRVITYETQAIASNVEAYYKDVMVQHGWQMTKSTPNPLIFVYSHMLAAPLDIPRGLPGRTDRTYGTGSVVDVSTQKVESGKIKVELRISGDEVNSH